jgi:hypothetical protein
MLVMVLVFLRLPLAHCPAANWYAQLMTYGQATCQVALFDKLIWPGRLILLLNPEMTCRTMV